MDIEPDKVEAIKTYLRAEFSTAKVKVSKGPFDPRFHVIREDHKKLTLEVTKECICYHDKESSDEMIQQMEKDEIPRLLQENKGSVIVFYSINKSPRVKIRPAAVI